MNIERKDRKRFIKIFDLAGNSKLCIKRSKPTDIKSEINLLDSITKLSPEMEETILHKDIQHDS